MFIEDDLDLHYTMHGEQVSFRPAVGVQVDNFAIFNDAGQAVFGGDLITTEPAIRYPVAVFPSVKRGDRFHIGVKIWEVREPPKLLSDPSEAHAPLKQVVA